MNILFRPQTSGRRVVLSLAAMLLGSVSFATLAADTNPVAGDTSGQPSAKADAAQFARGAVEWQQICGSCHNLRSPSELTNSEWEVAMAQMRVRAGLTGQQARDITAFLKASNSKAVLPLSPLATEGAASPAGDTPEGSTAGASKDRLTVGSDIYRKGCVACHGADGKGSIPGAPNFTDPKGVLSQADAVLESAIRNGKKTPGLPIAMPPNGGDSSLNADGIKSLVAYMRHAFLKK
jgi:mono/diheme cytochrome c family protein